MNVRLSLLPRGFLLQLFCAWALTPLLLLWIHVLLLHLFDPASPSCGSVQLELNFLLLCRLLVVILIQNNLDDRVHLWFFDVGALVADHYLFADLLNPAFDFPRALRME